MSPRANSTIFLVETSATIRTVLGTILREVGYTNLRSFASGQVALSTIEALSDSADYIAGNGSRCDLLLVDIDAGGPGLCRRLAQSAFGEAPVVVLCQTLDRQTSEAATAAGAAACIDVRDTASLVRCMDRLLEQRQRRVDREAAAVRETAPGMGACL